MREEKECTINKLRSELAWQKADWEQCRRRHLDELSRVRKEKQIETDRLQSEFGTFRDEAETEKRQLGEELENVKVERDHLVNTLKCDLQLEKQHKHVLLSALQNEVKFQLVAL